MDPITIAIILLATVGMFLFLGVQIGLSLTIGIFVVLQVLDVQMNTVILRMISGSQSFLLTAVPFFTLAGVLMRESGITSKISDFCMLLVGHLKGSFGHVNIMASMIFGGISGSSVADTASIGNVMIPEMIKQGYPKEYSSAITAASSTIGMIIPPSIPMIIYALASNTSIGKLFVAGAIPGVLVGLFMMLINTFLSHKYGFKKAREDKASLKEIYTGFKAGILALLMPLVIIFGITFGIVTATEAAVLAVLYAFIIGFFVYKDLKIKKLPSIFYETVITTGIVMFIVISANGIAWIFSYTQIPLVISDLLLGFSKNPYIILLIVNVILLLAGTISDITPNILILVPIFLPIITQLGIDPIHFGIIVILNQAIALVTPPVGNCLYICSSLGDVSVEKVFVSSLPFILSNFVVLIIAIFFPDLILWLPNLLM